MRALGSGRVAVSRRTAARHPLLQRRAALLLVAGLLVILLLAASDVLVAGRKGGGEMPFNAATGVNQAPGCLCHSATASPDVGYRVTGIPDLYSPGKAYPIIVSLTGGPPPVAGAAQGGFALVVSGGRLATEGTDVKVETFAGGDGKETGPKFTGSDNAASHTEAGTEQRSWALTWTAPLEGDVTFYIAVNAVNGNGLNDAGDQWQRVTAVARGPASGTVPKGEGFGPGLVPPWAWNSGLAAAGLSMFILVTWYPTLKIDEYVPEKRIARGVVRLQDRVHATRGVLGTQIGALFLIVTSYLFVVAYTQEDPLLVGLVAVNALATFLVLLQVVKDAYRQPRPPVEAEPAILLRLTVLTVALAGFMVTTLGGWAFWASMTGQLNSVTLPVLLPSVVLLAPIYALVAGIYPALPPTPEVQRLRGDGGGTAVLVALEGLGAGTLLYALLPLEANRAHPVIPPEIGLSVPIVVLAVLAVLVVVEMWTYWRRGIRTIDRVLRTEARA